MKRSKFTHVLHIDIETYSRVDLRSSNVYRYSMDRDFEILMAAWSLDGSPTQVYTGHEAISAIPGLWDEDTVKVAHNAQFERVCFSRLAGLPEAEFLPPQLFHDTMAVAGERGYPQKLEYLAVALGAENKDTAGTRLINKFCKPKKDGSRNLPADHPEDWEAFVEYCRQDVDTLRDVDARLGDFPTNMERKVYLTDQRINDRGIKVDRPMVKLALEASEENRVSHEAEFRELTGVDNPGSTQQVLAWLKDNVDPRTPNVRAETIEKLLQRTSLTDNQRRVLELRQELALVASKKFTAALRCLGSDARLRGTFQFFGAHTGRWSGRGVQLQNLPRLAFDRDAEVSAAIIDLQLGLGVSAEDLKKLVRPMFIGPFIVVDYAAIEARVLAWLAGEQWALDAFEAGRDIYVETAERMGGLTRMQGKIAVLALGYNGGVGSLRAMGGGNMYKNRDGEVVSAPKYGNHKGLRPVSDEDLQGMVSRWRGANRNITRFWKRLEAAFTEGGPAGRHINVEREGSNRYIRLPSGRALCYRRCHFGDRIKFKDPKGGYTDTYGGRLAENVTQAIARDIMAEALVDLQRQGYPVVGHVHDEIIVEQAAGATAEDVTAIMTKRPEWAQDLPIDGEGFVSARYRKG